MIVRGTDLVRVRASDKDRLNRLSGAMKMATGRAVTVGDVVADAIDALLVARPELAPAVAVQPEAVRS
jgi:hypothetical protein